MPENMNIAVLGPVPRDNITTYQGEKLEKFGCAVYTAVCISALAGAGSTVSLARQGGPMDPDEVAAFEARAGCAEAVRLRGWDDDGKVDGLTIAPLAAYEPLLRRLGER